MNNRRLDYLFELFAKFTVFRTGGINRDEAWYKLLELDKSLGEEDTAVLLKLAKDWERKEGHKYHYRNEDDNPTQTVNPLKKLRPPQDSVIRPLPAPPPNYQRSTNGLTGTLNPDALRSQSQLRIDQVLDQMDEEPPIPKGGTRPMQLPQAMVSPDQSPTYFGEKTVLLMYFKTLREPLSVRIQDDQEIIIGRTTENSKMAPEVDLTPARAGEYGVSRMHAAMKRDKNQLLITDLGSMNHTHINGKRLFPEEIRVLQDRDEIWFGRLLCRIHFYHQP